MKKIILTILLLGLSGCGQLPMGADVVEKKEVLDISTLQTKFDVATEIKDKYSLAETKLITKIEHKDDVKVAVGEDGEFKPNMEISRWDGEVKMKLKPRLDDKTKTKKLDFENNKIKYKEDKKEYHFYEIATSAEHPEGAYEFEIILLEKPATNTITLDIETEGLDFFYQPELTQEEIDEGAFRPENVIGSHAVYHSTKKNHIIGQTNYGTGKAFHIYRPKIIDSNGWEVWGELNINTEQNIQTVAMPLDFWDNAVYPIRHATGETFGNTSAGGSSNYFSNNYWAGVNFTSPSDAGTAISLSFSAEDQVVGAAIKAVIVLVSSSAIITNGVGNPVTTPTSKSWITSTFSTSPSLTPSVNYYLGFVANATMKIYHDTGSADLKYENDNNYSTPTNPADFSTNTDGLHSIYCTYEVGGGAADRRIFTTQ